LLLVESNDRLLAITFGHGRSLINQNVIVRGFGLRVAMNLGDPTKLKSLDKSTLDKVSLNTRSQSAKKTGVENFGFEYDHDILKSITAVVESEENELEVISGYDSVSLYTEVRFNTIQDIADRLTEAFDQQNFRETYPWSEYIEAERDLRTCEELERIVINLFNNDQLNDFWMTPPEVLDYMNFSGFVYRENSNPVLNQELSLSDFLINAGFRGRITVSSFKNKKIYVYDSTEQCHEKWSAFRCLNGEIDYDGTRYILNDGCWFHVKQSFYNEVCDYFSRLDTSALIFPDYQGRNEGHYLRTIANDTDLALLDQKWVRPEGVSNVLEFCDLYTQCKAIIHVKKYGSSSLLNHLFAQAFQSIEMLMNSPEVVDQVNVHLSNTSLSLSYDSETSPREHRIILAIMDHRQGDFDFPFFAKVTLRHYVRKIKSMGFNVELARIPIGTLLTQHELTQEEALL
jgi:uncharacterized protein (TIGR04141 family)